MKCGVTTKRALQVKLVIMIFGLDIEPVKVQILNLLI